MPRFLTFTQDSRATAAVEFAFITPLFLLMLFGIIAFGSVTSIYHSVEQITAEAARASLPGNTDAERDQLARATVNTTLGSYPHIAASKLSIATSTDTAPKRFKVSITYDMSGSFIFGSGSLIPLPAPRLTRSAVIMITDPQS